MCTSRPKELCYLQVLTGYFESGGSSPSDNSLSEKEKKMNATASNLKTALGSLPGISIHHAPLHDIALLP
jgi:hypothetical protein